MFCEQSERENRVLRYKERVPGTQEIIKQVICRAMSQRVCNDIFLHTLSVSLTYLFSPSFSKLVFAQFQSHSLPAALSVPGLIPYTRSLCPSVFCQLYSDSSISLPL